MKWLKDYFDFSRREETGIMVLAGMIVILFCLQYVWMYTIPDRKTDFTEIKQWSEKIKSAGKQAEKDSITSALSNQQTFDPNTTDFKGLIQLGFSREIAGRMIRYREKGGRFKKPDDLMKIYGMKEDLYLKLRDRVRISFPGKNGESVPVNLNTADSLQLLGVKGIGPVFASRILTLRKKLGAFVNKEQLMDVYGIDSDKFETLKTQVFVKGNRIYQLDINKAGLSEMRMHPYIGNKLGTIIFRYREANGPFKKPEDLKKIYAVDEKTFRKLAPYVKIQ
jgi:competence protein ComEA